MAIDLKEFESSGVNPLGYDKIGPTLDRKTTTMHGVVSQMAHLIFKNDYLDGIKFFKGQVLRVTEETITTGSFLAQFFGGTKITYKVRIPEVFSYLPIPKNLGAQATTEDQKIIDMYPDFVYEPRGFFEEKATVGDIVNTTFGNLSTFSEGRVLNKVGPAPSGYGSSGESSGIFPPVTVNWSGNKPPTTDTSGFHKEKYETHTGFKLTGEIEGITVGKNLEGNDIIVSQQQYDASIAMIEEMKKAKLLKDNEKYMNSMFRTIQKQNSIHTQYSGAPLEGQNIGSVTVHSPRGTNKHAYIDRSGKGPAALPGSSPHERAGAGDFNTFNPLKGTQSRKPSIHGYLTAIKKGETATVGEAWRTPRYIWMAENANKFGFDGTNGQDVTVNEPWHFNLIGAGAQAVGHPPIADK